MSTQAAPTPTDARQPFLTLFGSIRPYDRGWLKRDVVAGITLAALASEKIGADRIYDGVDTAREAFECASGGERSER